MRTKITLVLVFLNVALFFFIFKFERAWRTETQLLEARSRVFAAEAADIRWLEVNNLATPNASFTLSRTGDNWTLKKPLEWPANPHAVTSIINELRLLEHKSSFSAKDLAQNKQSLADYGLDNPKLKLEFRSGAAADAPVTKLYLGDITKVGNLLYVLTPADDRIHVVSRALATSLSLPLTQLRTDALLTISVHEARSLSTRLGASATTTRVRLESNARWTFDTPITARASKLEVDVVINDLNALRAVNFNPPTPATLPTAAPTLRIQLEGNNRHETLLLGESLGTTAVPTGAATAPDVEYYAQLEGRVAVFTVAVPAELLKKLRNAQESLREKRILDFDARAVTSITLTSPNQPPLTLQRDPAAPADSPWQIVRRADGGAAAAPLLADLAAVKRLLQQLDALAAKDVQGFVSDAPSAAQLENWGFNRPEVEVALTLTGTTAPLVLQIGTDAKRDTFARIGSATSSIYAVASTILGELHVAPREWRDHLVRALPPAARIATLKLTDLETNAVLFDLALDAAGHPKSDAKDPDSVAKVVAQLRSLRAQRFVANEFTEKIMFAGEERAWRYRLDATVALPGGAGGEQTSVSTLLLSVRTGTRQLAGVKEADAVFEIEQPFLDALWKLTAAGPPDAGPPAAAPSPAKAP